MSLAEQWYAEQMQRHQEFRQRQQSVAAFLEETRSHQQRVWLEERQKRAAFMAALRHSVWGKTSTSENSGKDDTGSGLTNKPEEVKWETLWQIGTPGVQEFPQTGGGIQVFNYDVEADPYSISRPQMPGWIGVPAILPYVRPLTTAQLNIIFTVKRNYAFGELVLLYDRFGLEEDSLFINGQLLTKIPGSEQGVLKQNQIPMVGLAQGKHILSITTSGGVYGWHAIDCLKLQGKVL